VRDTIEVIRQERITTVVEIKEAFEFRKDRPAHWLQKLCIWTLRKLGAFHHSEVVTFERHVIGKKGRRFMERLFEQRCNLRDAFNREPTRLLIGADDYAELMQEATREYFHFDAEYMRGGERYPKVCGLRVEVIPWMRGVLVMPNNS
jgi:hypothetical protein